MDNITIHTRWTSAAWLSAFCKIAHDCRFILLSLHLYSCFIVDLGKWWPGLLAPDMSNLLKKERPIPYPIRDQGPRSSGTAFPSSESCRPVSINLTQNSIQYSDYFTGLKILFNAQTAKTGFYTQVWQILKLLFRHKNGWSREHLTNR